MYVIAQYYPGTDKLIMVGKISVGKSLSCKNFTKFENMAQKFTEKQKQNLQQKLIDKGFKPISEKSIRSDIFFMEIKEG